MKLPLKPLLLTLGAAATVYALALLLGGERPAAQALRALLSPTGLLAVGLCLLNYLLRGLRWRLWMRHFERPLGLADGLRIYLAGYTFTPTPGNVGEAARGLLLARQPLGPLHSLAIFGAERLADLLGLMVLSLPGLAWLILRIVPGQNEAVLTVILALAMVLALLGLTLALRRRPHWLARFQWLQQAWMCLVRRPLTWAGLTLVAWSAQGLAVWLICREFGMQIDVALATGLYAMAMIGGALSMLPAGLGGTEAILTGLLMAQGAGLADAANITVLVRLLTLWLAVAIGAAALFYSAAIRKDISLR